MAKEVEAPAPRKSGNSAASKWKERAEEARRAGAAKLAKFRETEAGRRTVDMAEGVAGGAAAGFMDAMGLGIEVVPESAPGAGDAIVIPGGLVAGAAAFGAGTYMKQPDLAAVGYGAFVGGVALLVAEIL